MRSVRRSMFLISQDRSRVIECSTETGARPFDAKCLGFSGYQKCTAAPQMIAYGRSANSWDEYLRMSENTCRGAVARFATVVVEVFGPRYLREPTVADTERLLGISKARRWPSLLGSLDCMH